MADRDNPAGDLLIREVEEDLRREQLTRLWTKYRGAIIGGVLAVVLGVAGYEGWQSWQHKISAEESARYLAAAQQAAQGKTAEAATDLALLAQDGKTGYRVLAALRQAALLAQTGETAKAAQAYEAVAADGKTPRIYRDLATVMAAMTSLDSADPATLEGRLAPLTVADNPWRHSAVELTALLAQRRGDIQKAREAYQRLADDSATPQAMRGRAAEMLAALPVPAKG